MAVGQQEETPLLESQNKESQPEKPKLCPKSSHSKIAGEPGLMLADVNSLGGQEHRIIFDRAQNLFHFQLLSDPETHTVEYRLDELLTTTTYRIRIKRGIPVLSDNKTETEDILYFYFVYKKNKHIWRLKEIPLAFPTQQERDYWHNIIDSTLQKIRSRPKNMIVFINPFGGKGKAKKIFEKSTKPFFELTPGLKYEVLMTERADHAKDFILTMPDGKWKSVDGLVSVGGDGLFNELLSAGLMRTQKESGTDIENPDSGHLMTPHFRFGIIGAGSANSIVSTVHETNDWGTAAVHIALGSECNVDVCTVHCGQSLLRISANAISYGWLGDVLRDSERFRCLGPIRYQYSALRTTMRNPRYRGTVSFSLSPKETVDPVKHEAEIKKVFTETTNSSSPVAAPKYDYTWHSEFTHVICCVIPTVSPFTPHGLAPFTGIGDGTLDLAVVPTISRCANMRFMRRVAMYGGKGLYSMDRSLNCYRVLKWSFTPDDDLPDPGVWNLDGEILDQPKGEALHFRLHPQLISFFGRDEAMIEVSKRSLIKKRKSSIVYK